MRLTPALLLAVVGLGAGLGACGGQNPTPDPLRAYPPDRFITAEGYGPTRRAAEDDARARVAAGIQARLTARLTIETTEGPAGAEERIEQQIITESRFERAELIQLPPTLQRCPPSGCVAIAALDRQRAADHLRDAAAGPSSRLRAAVEQSQTEDIRQFTQAVRAAEQAYRALAPLGAQRSAITGAEPADFTADRARWRALAAERARRLTRVEVALPPIDGLDAEVDQRLRGALAEALSGLGVAHRMTTRPDQALALALSGGATVDCHRGPVGPRCALEAQLALRGPSEQWSTLDLSGAGLAAIDPRDPEQAREALLGRLTATRLRPAVQAALAPVLPIAAPISPGAPR